MPGVGSYDIAGTVASYQHGKSMGYKADSILVDTNKVGPGPGSYELNSTSIETETNLKRKKYETRNRLFRERQL